MWFQKERESKQPPQFLMASWLPAPIPAYSCVMPGGPLRAWQMKGFPSLP